VVDSPLGYQIFEGPPSPEDYVQLRKQSGLSPKSIEQARAALPGSWFACHVVFSETYETVGMGRVLGDGGWYFHIVDMAVIPGHQRRGIGDAVIRKLLERISQEAPPGALVNLLADPPGRHLYARHGFSPTAPGSVGMALHLA
jgi:ribosomal protein S18 acetylase RimI-like enzyme